MSDYLREFLYPLGFLSAMAFTGRMLLQWLTSEAKGRSVVMPGFWKLSLCGNILLAVHALIQAQFHVCAIQACNAIISWRNLDLMRPRENQISFRSTLLLLAASLASVIALFSLQGYFFLESGISDWFRIPVAPWQSKGTSHFPIEWHLLGFAGMALFSSRFWLQWWCAERRRESYLGSSFWWISLIGELMCLAYFLSINDAVNFIGPVFALIPYIRNLMLIYKKPARGLG